MKMLKLVYWRLPCLEMIKSCRELSFHLWVYMKYLLRTVCICSPAVFSKQSVSSDYLSSSQEPSFQPHTVQTWEKGGSGPHPRNLNSEKSGDEIQVMLISSVNEAESIPMWRWAIGAAHPGWCCGGCRSISSPRKQQAVLSSVSLQQILHSF